MNKKWADVTIYQLKMVTMVVGAEWKVVFAFSVSPKNERSITND